MSEKNPQMDWLYKLDQRAQEAYLELLKTASVRDEDHRRASESLEQAIQVTHELTIEFLRAHIRGGIG